MSLRSKAARAALNEKRMMRLVIALARKTGVWSLPVAEVDALMRDVKGAKISSDGFILTIDPILHNPGEAPRGLDNE